MAIFVDNVTGKIIAGAHGYTGIAIDVNCCCTVEVWKQCSDDVAVAYFSSGAPTHDYAWLCLDSIYVKCYRSTGSTSGLEENPDWLEQCGTPPASCSALVGLTLVDWFNGVGQSSDDIDAPCFTDRFEESQGTGVTAAVYTGSGGRVQIDFASASTGIYDQNYKSENLEAIGLTDLFHFKTNCNAATYGDYDCRMGFTTNAGEYYLRFFQDPPTVSGKVRLYYPGGSVQLVSGGGWGGFTGTMQRQSSSQLWCYGSNGAGAGATTISFPSSVKILKVWFQAVGTGRTLPDRQIQLTEMALRQYPSLADITYDPTGESCNIIEGGYPGTGGGIDLDGGTPSSTSTDTIDGGAP